MEIIALMAVFLVLQKWLFIQQNLTKSLQMQENPWGVDA
jgi:hypothetical protein